MINGSYAASVGKGTDELVKHLNQRYGNGPGDLNCFRETAIIGGYSQGADVVGWALGRNGGDGHVALSAAAKNHIGFVALYGDPKMDALDCPRPTWERADSGCDYEGILGRRNPYLPTDFYSRVGSWCDPGDALCHRFQTPPGNHTTVYRDYWILQSASEIAAAAIAKVHELNPPVPGPYHYGATVATASYPANGQQYVFWKGGDGLLWEAWYANNVWNGPISFPQFGILYSNPTVSVNPLNGEQHVFWRSGGGNLMQGWWDGSWHGPQDIGPFNMASAPTATAFGNEIDIFWKGQDNNLWEKWWTGTTWMGPINLGMGPLGSAPSAAAHPNGEQNIFWRGTDGLLTSAWYTNGSWHGPQTLNNMGFLGSAPTVNVRAFNNEQDVFWKGMDAQMWQAYYVNGVWSSPQVFSSMGLVGSPPASTSWGSDVDVFWVSNGGGVLMQAYYQNSTWHGPSARGMGVIPIQP